MSNRNRHPVLLSRREKKIGPKEAAANGHGAVPPAAGGPRDLGHLRCVPSANILRVHPVRPFPAVLGPAVRARALRAALVLNEWQTRGM